MDTNLDKKLDEYTKLIESYAWVALKKIMKPAKYSLDDLIQEGVLAFLYADKEFIEGRGASFRTYLTKCLRNHFASLVKQTYRNKETNSLSTLDNLQNSRFYKEMRSRSKKNTVPDASEIVQVSFLIKDFSEDELDYVTAVLSLVHKPRGGRRKAAREHLGISYEREVALRNSIRDKIRK